MMANAMFMPRCPYLAGTMEYPAESARGRSNVNHLSPITRQTLATDPVGTTTLTLQNVVNGSNIHIETQDGTVSRFDQQYGPGVVQYNDSGTQYDDADVLFDSQSNTAIALDVYEQGSALNDIRIRIRKGTSAPYYVPYETQVTLSETPASIYISQISDE